MAASKPTLIYFPFPGRAEIARLVFTLGKIDFEVGHLGVKRLCF